jgi:hypothetical protein
LEEEALTDAPKKNQPPHVIVPTSMCPTCGYVMTAAGVVDGSEGRPTTGDLTGCMACGEHLVYGEAMQVRTMTLEEYGALAPEQQRDLAKIRAFARTGWYR